jgi:hypothetical protein
MKSWSKPCHDVVVKRQWCDDSTAVAAHLLILERDADLISVCRPSDADAGESLVG